MFAYDTEILASCYPIESVQKFESKTCETTGWQEIYPAPDFLIRSSCIISLPTPISPLRIPHSTLRITYTGGYVLPDATPALGQTPLPPDLENAAVEQITYWFANRDHLGLKTYRIVAGVEIWRQQVGLFFPNVEQHKIPISSEIELSA